MELLKKRKGMERMERNEKERKGKGSTHGKEGRLPNGRRFVEREVGKNRERRREERKVGGERGSEKDERERQTTSPSVTVDEAGWERAIYMISFSSYNLIFI